jgi:phosphoribosyl 1,2-cyclic phosphate phosphodiesterase
MPVYGKKEVLEQLRTEFQYIFNGTKYPGVPRVELKEIGNSTFSINELTIEPVEVLHYKLPVFGFKIADFAYITDAKTIAKKEKAKLRGLDVLVLNALQHNAHISHLTLEEALELIEELKPKEAYLTHISHNLGLTRDVELTLPENVHLAYDGLKLSL